MRWTARDPSERRPSGRVHQPKRRLAPTHAQGRLHVLSCRSGRSRSSSKRPWSWSPHSKTKISKRGSRSLVMMRVAAGALEPTLETQIQELVEAIDSISSPEELRDLLSLQKCTTAGQRLLHYLPDDQDGTKDSVKLASPFVIQKLSERMLRLADYDREHMRRFFFAASQADALSEYIFQLDAHEALGRKYMLHARLLPLPKASSPSTADANDVVLPSNRVRRWMSTTPDIYLSFFRGPWAVPQGEKEDFRVRKMINVPANRTHRSCCSK